MFCSQKNECRQRYCYCYLIFNLSAQKKTNLSWTPWPFLQWQNHRFVLLDSSSVAVMTTAACRGRQQDWSCVVFLATDTRSSSAAFTTLRLTLRLEVAVSLCSGRLWSGAELLLQIWGFFLISGNNDAEEKKNSDDVSLNICQDDKFVSHPVLSLHPSSSSSFSSSPGTRSPLLRRRALKRNHQSRRKRTNSIHRFLPPFKHFSSSLLPPHFTEAPPAPTSPASCSSPGETGLM